MNSRPSALTFSIRGTVADIATSVDDEPYHPAIAVVVDAAESLVRIITPREVLTNLGTAIAIGQSVFVSGEVHNFPLKPVHVATEIRLNETLH